MRKRNKEMILRLITYHIYNTFFLYFFITNSYLSRLHHICFFLIQHAKLNLNMLMFITNMYVSISDRRM